MVCSLGPPLNLSPKPFYRRLSLFEDLSSQALPPHWMGTDSIILDTPMVAELQGSHLSQLKWAPDLDLIRPPASQLGF